VVIFPTFNKLTFTKKVVNSILSQQLPENTQLFLGIVDNASGKETLDYLTNLERTYEKVFSIRNSENRGFAKACNQAIEYFNENMFPDFDVLITNSDIEMLSDCIKNLYQCAYSDENIGIVGGKLLFPDGTIQHAGAFLNVSGCGQHIGAGVDINTSILFKERKEMEYCTGALFYIKNDVLCKIKGFDERFFMYFEEVSFCYDARKYGFKTIFEPSATAIHYEA
jgi:GT2 family glycosyltransferase